MGSVRNDVSIVNQGIDRPLPKGVASVDVGSLHFGLSAQKNELMRVNFAKTLAPGLKYIAKTEDLEKLLGVVTGKAVKLSRAREAGDEISFAEEDGISFSTERLELPQFCEAFGAFSESLMKWRDRLANYTPDGDAAHGGHAISDGFMQV